FRPSCLFCQAVLPLRLYVLLYTINVSFKNLQSLSTAPSATNPKQRHLFTPEPSRELVIHSGDLFTLPSFSIEIEPKVDQQAQNYWCELNTASSQYKSNIWGDVPVLNFTLSSRGGQDPIKSRCQIIDYAPEGK